MDGLLVSDKCALDAWHSMTKVVVVINYVAKMEVPLKGLCIVEESGLDFIV